MINQSNKIRIFDTTLRDGEQSPGASMTAAEKMLIALKLEKMGVDIIEAGFAVASQGDFDGIYAIASRVKNSTICSLARANHKDIDAAFGAIEPASQKRIHTFIATSPIHMQYKLKLSPDQVLERGVGAVRYARNLCDDVEFSCEDAGRSDLDFLCRIIEQAIDAGATTINIPDTVGYTVPEEFGAIVRNIRERVPNAHKAVFSAHCHNDLGLAVANSLAAIENGARQIECTINGLGERAGNTALEEVVMAIRTRHDHFDFYTDINTKEILSLSQLVSQTTGFPIQPNKAIVGSNAFAHEAGIHQDGMLKHKNTYEIMEAKDIGLAENKLVLGKHSGKNALFNKIQELGYSVEMQDKERIFTAFKALADKKHEIFDEDLLVLISQSSDAHLESNPLEIKDVEIVSLLNKSASCSLKAEYQGKIVEQQTQGNGPVDALFKALQQVVGKEPELELYTVQAITGGSSAMGNVSVRLSLNGKIANGHGIHTDIIMASGLAYIHALNALGQDTRLHAQASV